jgi:hypothetical protein
LLFRLAAGKLHANYGSQLKRLLCGYYIEITNSTPGAARGG